MTLREIAQRLKKAQNGATDKVRQIVADAGIKEFTIYSPPTARWMQILQNLGLSDLANISVCMTCYRSNESSLEAIEAQLKKHYKAVLSSVVDELGYRRLFACGDSADKPPQLILCANYYEYPREEVKLRFRSEEDSDANDDPEDANIFG